MVSHGLRHFIGFLFAIFFVFFLFLNYQSENSDTKLHQRTFRIFSLSRFSNKEGPGPRLAELFEKDCHCHVEFIEASDSSILLQRLKIEGESLGADLVLGLTSYDLVRASAEVHWKKHGLENVNVLSGVRPATVNEYFYPYDWNTFTFIAATDSESLKINNFQDLLGLGLRKKIGIEDPRTSPRGLGFLVWVSKVVGADQMNAYLESFIPQTLDIYTSLSSMEKDFLEKKSKIVFSFLTSALLKGTDGQPPRGQVLNLKESHPLFFEFVGIPAFCDNCELSQKFSTLLLSEAGQRILIKNQEMLSVLQDLNEKPLEEQINSITLSKDVDFISDRKIEAWLRRWTDLRRL